MKSVRVLWALVVVAAVAAGSLLDRNVRTATGRTSILAADLHVHPFPGDGVLSIAQLRREAVRRDLDVLGVTAHNNQLALRWADGSNEHAHEAIVLGGQEVTTPGFHLIALGIRELIDWRLPLRDAAEAIHRQGGVAIAAHPVARSWTVEDEDAFGSLDGIEIAHPMTVWVPDARGEFDRFFARVTAANPTVSPIGSSDFHVTPPLGRCRTYLLAEERTASAALAAIRNGRTVAQDENGRLYGRPEYVEQLSLARGTTLHVPRPSPFERAAAVVALLALAALAWPAARR